jgi:hypothetical protein
MAAPYDISLPPDLNLWDSCTIRVTAIDATTGAVVSGVVVSDVTLECVQLAGGDLSVGSFMLVPGPGA